MPTSLVPGLAAGVRRPRRGDPHRGDGGGIPSSTEHFWRVNTLGTRNVLDAAARAGATRFVLLSSVTVFGNDFPDDVAGDYPTRPTGVPYADTKIAAEHLCLDAHLRSLIDVRIVRPGTSTVRVVGPGLCSQCR